MVSIISPSCSFSSSRKTLKKLMSKPTSKKTRPFPILFQPRNNIIITKIGLEASHGSLVRVFSNNGVSFHVLSMYSIVYKNWNLFLDKIIIDSSPLQSRHLILAQTGVINKIYKPKSPYTRVA